VRDLRAFLAEGSAPSPRALRQQDRVLAVLAEQTFGSLAAAFRAAQGKPSLAGALAGAPAVRAAAAPARPRGPAAKVRRGVDGVGTPPKQRRLDAPRSPAKTRVLEGIRRYHRAGGSVLQALAVHHEQRLVHAARAHFGSWEVALCAAGLTPTLSFLPRKPQAVAFVLRKIVAAGRPLTPAEADRWAPGLAAQAKACFGPWPRVVAAAR
jgi:hypothetical protein